MADVKREVRALGQKITGLKAGDNVTLVLKKPKPRVDATAAKKAAKIANDSISDAKNALADLSRAHGLAKGGDHAGARKIVDAAKDILDEIKSAIPRAKDWAKTAGQDSDSAPGEVKDGYGAAKDGADLVVGHLEKVAEGFEKAITAVGALVEETPNRAGA
jgi:hypothetical protein